MRGIKRRGDRFSNDIKRAAFIETAHLMNDLGYTLEMISSILRAPVAVIKGALKCEKPKWTKGGKLKDPE